MPVTAKLSRKFYATFGDEIASELVDWFNAVDTSYRAEFRELFETHFARFDAKLEQQVGRAEARLDRRIAEMESRLRVEMANLKAEVLRWTFLFWIPTALAVIGLYFKS